MEPRRFVFDSNVLISAALFVESTPRAAVNRARRDGILLFYEATLAELVSRLERGKFDRWVSLETRLAFIEGLLGFAEAIEITGAEMGCRDPADDKFLETAEAGEAVAIVTGDADLLTLHPWREIPVLKPADFLSYRFDSGA
jgi:putative PIN family toxin of toxin-antitoxin system